MNSSRSERARERAPGARDALYLGLMSGTSLDGVDAALVDFSLAAPRIIAAAHQPFDPALRAALLELCQPGADEIERAALAGNELARTYAAAVAEVLAGAGKAPAEVRAIGCHGQTVRHRPERGYTVQLGNAALLAELSGIRVVADFRSRDIAAGGQGAPLAPAFHAAAFACREEDRVVLNLGGIANLTFLPRPGGEAGESSVTGFDSGPGVCLLDHWCAQHLGAPYDALGSWAAGGNVIPRLLDRLLEEPYFAAVPPKSTGRELFNARWLEDRLHGDENPRDVQATLLELTAQSVAQAAGRHGGGGPQRWIVCGGGAKNAALIGRLATLAAPAALEPSDRHGIDPQLVEAAAFAWLAKQTLEGAPGNLPAVTGARGARILGVIHP